MYKVLLRNNDTQEERWCIFDEEFNEWTWTEGNFGCDCNRHIFFGRAKGNVFFYEDFPCGEEKYTVVLVELENDKTHVIDNF